MRRIIIAFFAMLVATLLASPSALAENVSSAGNQASATDYFDLTAATGRVLAARSEQNRPAVSAGSAAALPGCPQTPPSTKYNIYMGTKYGGDACTRCVDQGNYAVQHGLVAGFYCWLTGPVGPEYVVDWWAYV